MLLNTIQHTALISEYDLQLPIQVRIAEILSYLSAAPIKSDLTTICQILKSDPATPKSKYVPNKYQNYILIIF